MDALGAVANATQIVSCMVGAVGALAQASRNLEEAPKRIRSLEEFVSKLENLLKGVKQRHVHKVHNPQLEKQISSLNILIERLHPNITKARKVVTKNKFKKFTKIVWTSVIGDPLSKVADLMKNDLNWWLDAQQFYLDVERAIESTASNVPSLSRITSEHGYPSTRKCDYVRMLLDHNDSHKVILIVGLSGIGKSCLARQVASDPPKRFIHGAVELRLGRWCSRPSCGGSSDEYHKRLARKICRFLVQIGRSKRAWEETDGELDDVCFLLQEALRGKSFLVLLDDVWEQDIVERFARLYDNDCKFLVTTRNEAIYEITEAEKIEISKDDAKEISKAIFLYHSLLTDDELPDLADTLLERCGHHPLTVAVMGKALRKELRQEKWESAITNLSAYATCAPGPVSYVNEKEVENTVTVFGSLEFSLEAMPEYSRRLFVSLAAVCWAEPVPESCLEALWHALGQNSMFSVVVSKLIEGSLLIRTDCYGMYHVHDMVSLYLDSKVDEAIKILLLDASEEAAASVAPWVFVFGKDGGKPASEQKMKYFLAASPEKLAANTLHAIVQSLMASKSVAELEASTTSFSCIIGPKIAELFAVGNPEVLATGAIAMANIFSKNDYHRYVQSLESVGAVEKLCDMMKSCNDPFTQTNICTVLAKMAEYGMQDTVTEVLSKVPMEKIAEFLVPQAEEWHDSIFNALLSLTKAGKVDAVEKIISAGIDKKLLGLLDSGSDVAQHHAIVMLKSLYEFGGPFARQCLRPGTLQNLPWNARFALERYVLTDGNVQSSPKPKTFDDLICKLQDSDSNSIIEGMQDLIPFAEKANEPRTRDMIVQSSLVEKLADLLRTGNPELNRVCSEAIFILLKLSCSGGERCIRKILEYNIVQDVVKAMQCDVVDIQDTAYTALHQMLFGEGGVLVASRILETGQIDRLVESLDRKPRKTKELVTNCLQDLAEVGTKACVERMLSVQVIEKLVMNEKSSGDFAVVKFMKGLDKCKNLTVAERWIFKQLIVRRVRTAIKGHRLEIQITTAMESYLSEGSGGSSSRRRKS